MKIDITHTNVVIVARQFNPSIITQLWLVKNDIIEEEEFTEDCVFLPIISHVRSREFNLLVLPEQLQFSIVKKTENEQELIVSKVGAIIQKLPHTPYVAAGLNFSWELKPESKGMGDFTRSLFYRDIPLYKEFNTEDSRFGAYMSKNVFGCRLRLNIKPVKKKSQNKEEEILQFAFNYNRELSEENKIEEILDLLGNWNRAKSLSNEIIEIIR